MITSLRPQHLLASFSIVITLGLFAGVSHAMDLLVALELAQQNDPEYMAARAAADAGETQRAQGTSLWLPHIGATVLTGKSTHDAVTKGAHFGAPAFGEHDDVRFETSIRQGTLERYEIRFQQPLFDRKRLAQSRQLAMAADTAAITLHDEHQSLIMRVAERYFDVLLTREQLESLQAQHHAVTQLQTEIQDRFTLGDVPITDTYETHARAEGIHAQVLQAEVQHELSKIAFTDLTGAPPENMASLHGNGLNKMTQIDALEDWLERASQHNPTLQRQRKTLAIAEEETTAYRVDASPTLELVGSASHENLHGSGSFGRARNKADSWVVGLQLSIPLYTGGYRSAKYREALHQRDETRFSGHHLQQQIERHTRAAWLGITVGRARVQALEQTLKSTQARLDATHIGHGVGDRTTLELLEAQNAATMARVDLLQARIDLILNRLRLATLAGRLDASLLADINTYLDPPTS